MTQAGDAMGAGSQRGGAQQGGTQAGAQGGAGVVDQAKDTAQHLAGQAKEQVTQRAQGVFDQGKARAAEQLTGVAQTLRQTTEQLQSGGQLAFAAPYLDRGVGQLERLADYVRTADVQDVAQQAEGFARRQPALFLGILFGTGILGARFLKSSKRDVQPQRSGSYPNYGSYGAGGYGSGSSGAGYGSGAGGSYGGGSASSAGAGYTPSQAGSQGAASGAYDGSTSTTGAVDSTDERGMDIGPTSSGLRGDI